MARIPAELGGLSDTVVLKAERAAAGTGEPATGPTGARAWITEAEPGADGQGAAEPGSQHLPQAAGHASHSALQLLPARWGQELGSSVALAGSRGREPSPASSTEENVFSA